VRLARSRIGCTERAFQRNTCPGGRLFVLLNLTVMRGKIVEIDVVADTATFANSSWRSYKQCMFIAERLAMGSYRRQQPSYIASLLLHQRNFWTISDRRIG
jgi:hypothetical protein